MDITKELKNTIYNTKHNLNNVAGVDTDVCKIRAEERKSALSDPNRLLRLLETPELPAEKPKPPEQLEADDLKRRMEWKGNMGG